MRKVGLWAGCAVLLLALGLVASAGAAPPADDDDGDGKPVAGPNPAARPRDGWNPLLTRLLKSDDKKPAAKPERAKEADKKADLPEPRTEAASLRRLEEMKLHRRQEVCLRLREIARETNDAELEQRALELDERAFQVYMERTAHLPGGSDPEALQRDARPVSGGTASVREVKP
jgi:hypothetical protein